MESNSPLRFTYEVLYVPLAMVFAFWIVFWIEIRFGVRFTKWGIFPLEAEGLKGILFAPFIHGSLKHLFNNSVPLLVLTCALFYFYRNIRWKVLLLGYLLTGLLTWLIARPAWHIGASGIIYLLAAFLFFKGIFSKHFRLVALSLLVVFLYGSMLWYLFPIKPGISWEGHLSGFLIGFLFAIIFRKDPIAKPTYEWQQPDYKEEDDPFLKHFDEDGNFMEILPEDVSEETSKSARPIKVVYHFKNTTSEEE